MNTLTCQQVRESAAEIALGLVSGPERAEVFAHLESCAECRANVDELAMVVDELLTALPGQEPPSGFELAVLDRITQEQAARTVGEWATDRASDDRSRRLPRARRARRANVRSLRRQPVVRWVAAAAAAVLLVLGGFLVGDRSSARHDTGEVRAAAMVSPSGKRVGRAELGRNPGTVFVALPGWAGEAVAGTRYHLRVSSDDGTTSIGPFELTEYRSTWGGTVNVDTTKVRSIAMVDDAGHVYCSARFA